MGKMSRDKGKRGEREIAAWLREAFPECADDIRRGWQSRQGDDEADVVGAPYGIWPEVKRSERLNVHAALRQAEEASPGDQLPVVFHRRNKDQWNVTMRRDVFEQLLLRVACEAALAARATDPRVPGSKRDGAE